MPNLRPIWVKSTDQELSLFTFRNLQILETIWTDYGNNGRLSKSNTEIKIHIKSI